MSPKHKDIPTYNKATKHTRHLFLLSTVNTSTSVSVYISLDTFHILKEIQYPSQQIRANQITLTQIVPNFLDKQFVSVASVLIKNGL